MRYFKLGSKWYKLTAVSYILAKFTSRQILWKYISTASHRSIHDNAGGESWTKINAAGCAKFWRLHFWKKLALFFIGHFYLLSYNFFPGKSI